MGCRRCGAQTVVPYPTSESIASIYDNHGTTRTPEERIDFLIDVHMKFFRSLEQYVDFDLRQGSYLEIGFGNGTGLLAAAKFGIGEVYGVDLDPQNVMDAKGRADARGLRVGCLQGDAVTGLPSGRRYRLVKASHLIEHLTNPADFIQAIASRQQRGDYLFIECPNNSAAFLLMKNLLRRHYNRMDFFNSLRTDFHLWGFSPKSMSALLRRNQYEIVFCRGCGARHPYFHPENLLSYTTVREGIDRAIHTRQLYPVLKSFIGAFDSVASLVDRGMELAALARKVA